jgi:hypothetical protein
MLTVLSSRSSVCRFPLVIAHEQGCAPHPTG